MCSHWRYCQLSAGTMFCRERWLLSALLLLGFIAGGTSELQYVLTSPATLFSGETGRACLILMGNKEILDVGLVLQHDGKNTTIIAENVASPKYFQCADYQIPTVAKAVPVSLLLSVKGPESEVLERKTAVIKPNQNKCTFQMDKPVYKTSQNVHFRIICLNPKLKPTNEKFTSVRLQDPSNARIKQWLKQETQNGVASFDFKLIDDAPLGSYRIVAERESGSSLSNWFSVENYVPPRFSMKVEAPDTISVLDDTISYSVAAVYNYGEPVAGDVTMQYCKEHNMYGRRKNCFKDQGDRCATKTGKLNSEGVYKDSIDMTKQLWGSSAMSVRIDFTVTEEGSGIQISDSRYTWVTTQPSRINFDYSDMQQHYRRGIPYTVKATLTDEKDKPIPEQEVEIEVDNKLVATVKTDAEGKIQHEIDTSDMVAPNFTVKANYKNPDQCYYAEYSNTDYPTTEHTAYRFYSKTGSFMQAKPIKGELQCGETRNVELQYSIGKAGLQDGQKEMTFVFMYQSNGRLVHSSEVNVDLTNSLKGTVNIPVTATADMAPNTNILAMGILNGELIADIIPVEVESCFKNDVSMTFSSEKGMPGSTAEVILSGDPNSICGLKVIDSSLLLMNRYEQFTPQHIRNLFSYWSYGYNIEGFNVEDPEPPCLDPNKLVFFEGNYYLPTDSASEGDSYRFLKQAGMLLATKLQTRKPKVCVDKPQRPYKNVLHGEAPESAVALKSVADRGFGGGAGGAGSVETLRKNFSDSFMWFMVPLDKDGHASLSEKVPDSLTQWQGSAFCMSEKGGFGMTKYAANYTASMPFFIDYTVPNSFYRGETLVLRATVRNFLDHCVKAEVTLEPSDAFTAEQTEGTQNACLCPKEQATHSWNIQARNLGEMPITASARTTFIGESCDGPNDESQPSRKDTMIKTILSKPEGIPQERTLSNLMFVKPEMKLTVPVSITPPSNVVPDSMSAHVTAVGDMLALPLNNLEDLVRKPYLSGEQNLARIAPVIYVLDYLNATGQLKDEILQKGKQQILEGYYRHLGYAYGEAYKVFRSSDQPNTWLTLFSFKVLEQAKRYVEIDETRQQQTLIWLQNQQKLSNGCFEPQGSLFTFRDIDRSVFYTAHVAIALMETQYSLGKTMLEGAMECLKNASKSEQDIIIEVLMLYAFTLANKPEHRDPLMLKLMKKAKVKDGTMHWERKGMPILRPVPFFSPIYASPEVQLTSLMLLSILGGNRNAKPPTMATSGTKSKPSAVSSAVQQTLTTAAQVSLWISQQMNGYGGLPSSTDTIYGLQALTAFGRILYTPDSKQTLRFKHSNGDIGTMELNHENRMLMQRFDLPKASGDYSMEVEGNGWSLVQVKTKYNIQIPKENSAFDLSLSTSSNGCVNGVAKTFNISVRLSYKGEDEVSEMTTLQINMMSGYKADYWSLKELENNKVISSFQENMNGDVIMQMENLTKDVYFYQFTCRMDNMVLNIKESSGMVYNTYNEAENGFASYKHPCVE